MWITNWLAAAGLTTIVLEVALVRLPPVNLSEIVSALSSARFVNVATPPDTVTVVVPWSGPAPLCKRRRHHRAVVACLQVAELVLFIDHRLGRERLLRPSPSLTAGCGSPTGWPPPG